jgi:(1->4)-alpha-D-glucan 1-alpha-D-glucosylmutase
MNASLIETADGEPAPSPDDEYLIYQTLVGAWPLELDPGDQTGLDALRNRLAAYVRKAGREAARRTSWIDVNEAYEQAAARFVGAILDPKRSAAFLQELTGFTAGLAPPGAINGLVQTVLKLTLPGVPDIYQGAERWDLSLVDPDNRRPVDFSSLSDQLRRKAGWRELLAAWPNGRIKQAVIQALLKLRRADPALFERGDYRPLEAEGANADRVLAFARVHQGRALIVAAPRLTARLVADAPQMTDMAFAWNDCRLLLPERLQPLRFRNALADAALEKRSEAPLALADLFQPLPFGVLTTDA